MHYHGKFGLCGPVVAGACDACGACGTFCARGA